MPIINLGNYHISFLICDINIDNYRIGFLKMLQQCQDKVNKIQYNLIQNRTFSRYLKIISLNVSVLNLQSFITK
jgi:hypothetical protein